MSLHKSKFQCKQVERLEFKVQVYFKFSKQSEAISIAKQNKKQVYQFNANQKFTNPKPTNNNEKKKRLLGFKSDFIPDSARPEEETIQKHQANPDWTKQIKIDGGEKGRSDLRWHRRNLMKTTRYKRWTSTL